MAELTSVDISEPGVPPSKRPRMSECGEKSRFDVSVVGSIMSGHFVPVDMDYGRPHQYHMIRGTVSPFN